ncbi:phosphatase, putative [Plasmodium gallinaceum]|uniref:Phosphatase, putative n=1 Tax=Plasmodium gallinaceum TaxID=5849 RepID=A0A1J1GLV5_PLAGA|nr:phosphatase, putative [Plasmodium gallinaceum]CRG93398.1 phosphatase, putative [Plasmodium gallinaceum]
MALKFDSFTNLRIKKSVCIKYLKFLFYLKRYNFENKWNRYYCCLFQTIDEKTTLKKLVLHKFSNNFEKIKKKEILFKKYLSYLISKPIKIASFDFDGTLINSHFNKHKNNLLYDKNVLNTLYNLKNEYKIIIFSNQTNVSSCVHDYDHLRFQKLPNFFLKIRNFKNSLKYFYTLFCDTKRSNFSYLNNSHKTKNKLYLFILNLQNKFGKCKSSYLYRKYHSYLLNQITLTPQMCNYLTKKKKNFKTVLNKRYYLKESLRNNKRNKLNFLYYFFSIGKYGIEDLDIYTKPNVGQFALYICLEAIKYLIILNFYFKNSFELIKKEISNIENKELRSFILLSIDIFNIDEIRELTKNIKRKNFYIDKISLKILDIYVNFLLKKTKPYIFVKQKYPNSILIDFFLNDQITTNIQNKKEIWNLLNDNENLKYLIFCLIYKNKIMKNLMKQFSNLLFNFKSSFYVGNNIGRPFDKSDIDLKVIY